MEWTIVVKWRRPVVFTIRKRYMPPQFTKQPTPFPFGNLWHIFCK